jgi:YD repeat-containing protein
MRILLIIVATLPALDLVGQNFTYFEEVAEKARLKRANDRVRAERIYFYSVDKKGNTKKKGQLRGEMIYDKNGRSIKNSGFWPDMTIVNETEYNDKGLEIKMISKDGSGKLRQTLVHEYDENNKLIRVNYYGPDGKLSNVKDMASNGTTSHGTNGKAGNQSESKYDSVTRSYNSVLLSPTGKLMYRNKYWYNESGQISEWQVTDNIQNKHFVTKYVYDDAGNSVEVLEYSIDNKLVRRESKSYNDKAMVVESITFEPPGKKKMVFRYVYEYF